MKNTLLVFVLLIFNTWPVSGQQNKAFRQLLENFAAEYPKLGIPQLNLSYMENLNSIPDEGSILEQKAFFKKYLNELFTINAIGLSKEEQLDYYHLRYEISVNWERLNLEAVYRSAIKDAEISDKGLIHAPLGEQWYLYYLKKWLSVEMSAEELMEFGMLEIEKVQLEIQRVQRELGYENDSTGFYNMLNGKQFFESDQSEIFRTYLQKKEIVKNNYQNVFLDYGTPDIAIEMAPADGMNDVPGYYSIANQTFYFNIFDGKYNTRNYDWLYIHEGVPGHHFQTNIESANEYPSGLRSLFRYPAYLEGWAAYCEEIGNEIGLYQNTYDYLGKLEWDLVRSVRVVLDIGLNYYGWSDEEAVEYWKENIINQDQKAMREIQRMKRWPAQVLTYKIGAAKILEIKEKMKQQLGDDFDAKEFHDKILKAGPVPLHLLEKYVLD